ncbi:MAG TPA: hypothetical protein VGO13_10385 [Solirubrobacterales bacterium]|jgi:hypothetical protein|nr:hypothetical protein [Solirubrobacterales bacterium]
MTPIVKVDRGNFDSIYRRAFERFLLELAQQCAIEEERISLERTGRKPSVLIKEVQLSGEYPDTAFRIKTYDRIRKLEHEDWQPIWRHSEWFDKDMKLLCEPEQIVSYTLMWARGG